MKNMQSVKAKSNQGKAEDASDFFFYLKQHNIHH